MILKSQFFQGFCSFRLFECGTVCVQPQGSSPILIPSPRLASTAAEMNPTQTATRNLQHSQTKLKLFVQRPADLKIKSLNEVTLQPKTNPLVPGFNPPNCDDQPRDRTQTRPRQTAGLGHLLDQDWTGEGRTRLTGPTKSQETSA